MKLHSLQLNDLFDIEPEPLDFCLPGLVIGTIGAIVSQGGVGKSMLAIQLASQITTGNNILGLNKPLNRGKVVYLPAEDPVSTIHHRLHNLGKLLTKEEKQEMCQNFELVPLIGKLPDINDSKWFEWMLKIANGKRLIILDTLRRFHLFDENDSGEMTRVLSLFERIAEQTNCSIIFLHHTNKSSASNNSSDQQQASRGSSVLTDNIRWQAFVTGMSSKEATTLSVSEDQKSYFMRFGISKQNYDKPFNDIWFRRHEGGILKPAVLQLTSIKSNTKTSKRREQDGY